MFKFLEFSQESISKSKINLIKDFNNKLNKFEYKNSPNVLKDKYKICSPSQFYKNNGGVCWDFVVAQADFFNKNKIKYDCYLANIADKNRIKTIGTHTFTIIRNNVWFESAFYKYRGIHENYNYFDVSKLILEYFGKSNILEGIYLYDPIKTINMNINQFFDYINKYATKINIK